MPRPKSWKPGHLLHKSSGRAYVVLDGGPPIYLGKYGTQESRDKYDQIIGEWIARGRVAETKKAAPDGTTSACVVTVSHVCWSFWQYALRNQPKHQPRKFIFAKAVELELVPGETYAALAAVPGLRKGHPSARRRR
jgi:hypothetical protein